MRLEVIGHDHHYRRPADRALLRRRDGRNHDWRQHFSDMFAKVRDIVSGRAGAYESALKTARREAFAELGHEAREAGIDAVVGVGLDYEAIRETGSMLMVSVSGTAVQIG